MAEAKAQELIAKADKKLTSMFASLFGNKYEDAEVLYSKAANQLKVAKNCECFAARRSAFLSPFFPARAPPLPSASCCSIFLRTFFTLSRACNIFQGTARAQPSRRRRSAT